MAWLKAHPTNLQAGLSLLGTLVAAFLLASTAAAISQLVVHSQRASQSSRERLLATAVGREGLELVRALRDTNWFLRQTNNNHSWVEGLCRNSATGEEFSEKREFTLDPAGLRRLEPVGGEENSALAIVENGEWGHGAMGRPTAYQRKLSVDCREQDIFVLVTATVTWQGRDRQDHIWTVSERLYDWLI